MPEKPRGRQRVFPARDSNMNLVSGEDHRPPGRRRPDPCGAL